MNQEEFERILKEKIQTAVIKSLELMLKRFEDGTATEKDDANIAKMMKDNNLNLDTYRGNVLDDITQALKDKHKKELNQPNLKQLENNIIDKDNNDIDLLIDAMVD